MAEARREYQTALEGTLVGRSTVLVAIGRLAQVQGDPDGAIDAFAEAVRLDPNDPLPHKELAGAYTAQGRTAEAFSELMAALLISARDAQAHVAIGQLFLDTGRAADAASAFSRALELAPDHHEAHYALATALTRLGRTAEAAREFDLFERARQAKLDDRRRDIQREAAQEGGGR